MGTWLRTGEAAEGFMGWFRYLCAAITAAIVLSAGAAANAEGFAYGPASAALKMTRISTIYLTPDGLAPDRVAAVAKDAREPFAAAARAWNSEVAQRYTYTTPNPVDRRLPIRALAPGIATAAGAAILVPAPKIPTVPTIPFTSTNLHFFGFTGLTDLESEKINSNQSVEPPDQGLCAGNGTVVEMVNDALVTYDTSASGKPVFGPISLSHLFSVPLTDFVTNPRCYYDSASNIFFMTASDLGNFPVSTNESLLLLAVMPAGNTKVVNYAIQTVDTDNANCPCFEDEPLLGADANGIYLSGNKFTFSGRFIGAQIFAINKAELVAEAPQAGITLFSNIVIADNPAATIQPALPAGSVFESVNGGTEYFLSSLDPLFFGDNRIAVWALINTCGLVPASGPPACGLVPALSSVILTGLRYAVPPVARQRSGPFPLGVASRGRLETLDTDDDRMQQVVFANGLLYSALTTKLRVGGQAHSGLLYFIVQPGVTGGSASGAIIASGYVAHRGLDLFYPSVAATTSGAAAMTFSLSGAVKFPSVGYIPITSDFGAPRIHIAATGAGPEDGFSGYPPDGAGLARWGNYSAAVADGNNLWMAAEYVPGVCRLATYRRDNTCGGMRGSGSNYGTFVMQLSPGR
jgi:hypothetical protein